MEVAVHYMAAELTKLKKKLEERFLHKLVDQAVEKGIVQFGVARRRQPSVKMLAQVVSVHVSVANILVPSQKQVFQLLECLSTGNKLVQVGVKVVSSCRCFLLLLPLASGGVTC